MQFWLYTKTYFIICAIIYGVYFFITPYEWNSLKEIVKIKKIYKATKAEILIIKLISTFVTVLFPLIITIKIILEPFYLKGQITETRNYKKNKKNNIAYLELKKTKSRRNYIPIIDMLFLYLDGYFHERNSSFDKHLDKFSNSNIYAFPIFHNNHEPFSIKHVKVLKRILKFNVELFFLETPFYFDPPLKGNNYDEINLSNSNYAFFNSQIGLSSSAISIILNLEMDGIDKIIFVDKSEPNAIFIANIIDLKLTKRLKSFDHTIFRKHALPDNITSLISGFLSLKWVRSKSETHEIIKKAALEKREVFLNSLRNLEPEKHAIISAYEYSCSPLKEPHFYYNASPASLSPDNQNELIEIKAQILFQSLYQIQKKFPNYSVDLLKEIKKVASLELLEEIEKNNKIDFESRMFIKTANLCYRFISDEPGEYDFSPVAIGYTKFFENQINLSFVQKLRENLGIKMPDFYNEFCQIDGEYIIYLNQNMQINYNMKNRKSGKYLPPGLGQTLNVFDQKKPQMKMAQESFRQIIILGKRLNEIRNLAAHPEIITKKEVEEIRTILLQLIINKSLDDILALQRNLRNN